MAQRLRCTASEALYYNTRCARSYNYLMRQALLALHQKLTFQCTTHSFRQHIFKTE